MATAVRVHEAAGATVPVGGFPAAVRAHLAEVAAIPIGASAPTSVRVHLVAPATIPVGVVAPASVRAHLAAGAQIPTAGGGGGASSQLVQLRRVTGVGASIAMQLRRMTGAGASAAVNVYRITAAAAQPARVRAHRITDATIPPGAVGVVTTTLQVHRVAPLEVPRDTVTPAAVAPLQAFARGTETGVIGNPTLVTTTGLPTPDQANATWTDVDPITGQTVTRTVSKYTNRVWNGTLSRVLSAGQYLWFDNCRFVSSGGAFCVELDTSAATQDSRLLPVVIFTNCEFDGGSNTGKGMAVQNFWAKRCEITTLAASGLSGTAEDGVIGMAESTLIECNLRGGRGDNTTDPHPDPAQLVDFGKLALYRCWLDSGNETNPIWRGNAMLRIGTESVNNASSQVRDIWIYYCGIAGNGFNGIQLRDNSGNWPILGVRVKGNRWLCDGAGFLYDFDPSTEIVEWDDNRIGPNQIQTSSNGVTFTTWPANTLLTQP